MEGKTFPGVENGMMLWRAVNSGSPGDRTSGQSAKRPTKLLRQFGSFQRVSSSCPLNS